MLKAINYTCVLSPLPVFIITYIRYTSSFLSIPIKMNKKNYSISDITEFVF